MCQNADRKKKVKVIVLGDIGRSPRMQYHTLSLANAGFTVDLISYQDTKPLCEILENENIHLHKLKPLNINIKIKILQYTFKALWQFFSVMITLFVTGNADYLLCQNPPAIPTLPACWLYCFLTKTRFVIDWHNYAYSIMAINLRNDHPLIFIAKKLERIFGRLSYSNFCVTEAMKRDLEDNWKIRAKVLYDRPSEVFKPITIEEKHNWFLKLNQQYPELVGRDSLNLYNNSDNQRTLITEQKDGKIVERHNRYGIIFSSTSWTEDEDFSLLFKALDDYEKAAQIKKNLPPILCVITGKGPLKEYYLEKIKEKTWRHVKVFTPWLEAEDYPLMVASADLGVCLHTSSSGLDLPMKIVDMFGAGLPVLAYEFPCLNELVKNEINGCTFTESNQLSEHIIQWFESFPNNPEQNKIISQMKSSLENFRMSSWNDNWDKFAKKVFVSEKKIIIPNKSI